MLFERFEVKGLAHYSYAVGCQTAGEMAIVDARRDVDVYIEFAAAQGMRITHVLETHIHADYASGAHALAAETGATLYVSGHDSGEIFEVNFPHTDMSNGDEVTLGAVRLRALHTPGHTPEHLSFLVFDGARSAEVPELMLSGDFLFVGSLGRPDLLGEKAKLSLARAMFGSVRDRIADLPDGLEVHPAHGAGSMCGAGMSGRAYSTLGYERIANPFLDPKLSEDAFVDKLIGCVPPFPDYYRRMKALNSEGPAVLDGLPGQVAVAADEFQRLAEAGHLVIDLRDQLSFGAGHVPGALGIGAGPNLSTWAAWVVPPDAPLLLVGNGAEDAEGAARSLVRVGLDDIRGFLAGGMNEWEQAGLETETLPQLRPQELSSELGNGSEPNVVDVRSDAEWSAGHIDGAVHIMGEEISKRLAEVPDSDLPLALVCGSGYRSTVAASVLRRAGYERVINVTGGMDAWSRAGLPVSAE